MVPKFDDKIKIEQASLIYQLLVDKGVHVLYDDRTDLPIGAKIKDSKIIGTPYVAVFGKTLENNLTGEKTEMSLEKFAAAFISLENNRTTNIEDIVKKTLVKK